MSTAPGDRAAGSSAAGRAEGARGVCGAGVAERVGSGSGAAPFGQDGRGDARLTAGLIGRALPALSLARFDGRPVRLPGDSCPAAVIYLYPASRCSPDGGPESLIADDVQHRAFAARCEELRACSLSVAGVSSESQWAQRRSVAANRLCHELWSDPQLLLAQALGLATFTHEGACWYRRLTLVVRDGVIAKAFFPVQSPARSAAQVLWWMKATGW